MTAVDDSRRNCRRRPFLCHPSPLACLPDGAEMPALVRQRILLEQWFETFQMFAWNEVVHLVRTGINDLNWAVTFLFKRLPKFFA